MSSKKRTKPQQEFAFDSNAWAPAPPHPDDDASPGHEDHEPMRDGPGPLRTLMDGNFLAYASYVICDRAIPDLEDGLKPVQRRILHALHDRDDGRFIKVANIVGHTMQYHPHGDASIADALVNLTNKRFLIEGQGNFGNIYTGDSAAASRYIECRLTNLARKEVFNKDLTEFIPSYDGRNNEPVTLPCKLPLLLMLGAEGIAVGLSTRIFPHNFSELIEAQIAILQKKPFKVLPDFQLGGLMDVTEYSDGNGRLRLRAVIEESSNNRLIIRELPHGQTTESLTSSIEDAVRKKKIPIRSINDFTAEKVEIELVLSPGTKPAKAIQALYGFTSCETTVSGHMVVIHNKRPRDITVSEALKINTQQLVELLKRELEFRRGKLLDEFHNKTLVQIFVENRIYKRIEECKTYPDVIQAVFDGLAPFRDRLKRDVTKEDIEMLLGIRIRRISRFDIEKNQKDIADILKELATIEKHLKRLTPYAVKYLKGLLKEYGNDYPRRTKIQEFKAVKLRELTANELSLCVDENGYLGYNVKGDTRLQCSSLDKIMLVWNNGSYKVVTPPEKLFVDNNLLYCQRYDREKEFTVVFTADGVTYIKRFTFGGVIMNKDYSCALEGAKVLLFQEGCPEQLYLKYKPAKGQRIHQQMFRPGDVPVKGAKARGNQMTAKRIARIATEKPRWWDDTQASPKGRMV